MLIKLKKAWWGPWVCKDMKKLLCGFIYLHTHTNMRTRAHTHKTEHIERYYFTIQNTFYRCFRELLKHLWPQRQENPSVSVLWSHSSYILYLQLSISAKDRHYNLRWGEIRNPRNDLHSPSQSLTWHVLERWHGCLCHEEHSWLAASWNQTTNPLFFLNLKISVLSAPQ